MDSEFFDQEIIQAWMDDAAPDEEINRRYQVINCYNSVSYDYVLTSNNYFVIRRDYGTGDQLTMIEAHVLTDIVDNPGIWISDLARKWQRTRSALSQTVKKLRDWGYVDRINSEKDNKYFHLYPTEKGLQFVRQHKRYDVIDTVKMQKALLQKFTPEELEIFHRVMEETLHLLQSHMVNEHQEPAVASRSEE